MKQQIRLPLVPTAAEVDKTSEAGADPKTLCANWRKGCNGVTDGPNMPAGFAAFGSLFVGPRVAAFRAQRKQAASDAAKARWARRQNDKLTHEAGAKDV